MKYSQLKPFRQPLLAIAALAAFAISGPVSAQAIIGADTMTVTANVLGVCTVSANNLNFGPYQQNSVTDVQAQTTVDVNCPVSVAAYELGISVGPTPGTTTTRAMTGGVVPDTLDYDLYTD
ncbi:MAG: spore coat U domain-containing protein, partial [Gammaproteobacteria bacterium]|nr:spore coat U domain-containing protein [Gammaproteobacteria bacterium]